MSRLTAIMESKRAEVEGRKAALAPAELRAMAKDAQPRDFRGALLSGPTPLAVIAEVKKASPSQGLIRANFSAAELAITYELAGASCLSVLTDAPYFMGSPDDLIAARAAVRVPILRKDFMLDPYQLDEALLWGADCILLIAAALQPDVLQSMNDEAMSRGLHVLVEVHSAEELDDALALQPRMVGVNNRDLATFQTDLAMSERLLPQLPEDVLGIAESALDSHEAILRMARAGARAVLIGTALAGSDDPAARMKEVMGW